MPTFRDDLHLGHSVPMVDTEDIVDGAVTEPKLADDSVSTRTIQDGAVTEPKIAEKAVTEPKLADAAVSTRTIKFRAVTESKIGDSAVSTRTIQNGAVTNPKIANGAVSMSKLSNEAQTLIQRGADSSWTPKGAYNENTVYGVNDLVYYTDTNSSYISLQANNQGHNPAWQSAEDGWWMMVVSGLDMKEIAEHPTYVGEDNYVYNYDFETHSYIKTDIYVKGDTGDIIYPILEIDENGHIIVSYSPTPPEQQNDDDIDENDDVNIEGGE